MSKIAEKMRQYREKQLMLKAQKQREAYRPSHLKPLFVGVDQAAAGTDQTVVIPVNVAEQNIELRLQSYLDQLSNIRAIDKKVEFKKQWLPEFQGYIDACLAQSPAEQNHALMHLLVWAIDVEDLALAARIGQHAILNGMVMPERYKRTVAEVLAENIGEACIKNVDLAIEHADLLESITEMIRGEDIVNEAHAKIYKALGLGLEESKPTEALAAFKNALRLNVNVGVKKNIEKLERLLKRNTTESSHDQPSGSQDVATSVDTNPVSTAHQIVETSPSDSSPSDTSTSATSSSGE